MTLIIRSSNPAAVRMRRLRKRRRSGVRYVRIELRDSEIAALIKQRYLVPQYRDEPGVIEGALETFIGDKLV